MFFRRLNNESNFSLNIWLPEEHLWDFFRSDSLFRLDTHRTGLDEDERDREDDFAGEGAGEGDVEREIDLDTDRERLCDTNKIISNVNKHTNG